MANFVSDPDVRPSRLSQLMIDWSSITSNILSFKSSLSSRRTGIDTMQLGSFFIVKNFISSKKPPFLVHAFLDRFPSLKDTPFFDFFSFLFSSFTWVVWDPYCEFFLFLFLPYDQASLFINLFCCTQFFFVQLSLKEYHSFA
jgi:hypothetical protein